MKNNTTDTTLVTTYKAELYSLGYAKSTIHRKQKDICNFILFTKKQLWKTTLNDIDRYIDYLLQKKLHSSTITYYYKNIKAFFLFLHTHNIITKNPFHYHILNITKNPFKQRTILTQKQIQLLYKAVSNSKELIILHLAYGCGLRAKEIEQLNCNHIDLKNKILKVKKGKFNKHRNIPLNQTIAKDFNGYLQERKNDTQKAFLLNTKGNRMRYHTMSTLFKKNLENAKISRHITLHALRHSIATHLLENQVNIKQVQLFLGHTILESTEIYTRINNRQLKKIQKKT